MEIFTGFLHPKSLFEPTMRATHYTQHRFWLDPLLVLSLIAVVSVILSRNALQVFDFFDMSAFMDAGYRVYIGQEPYVDFYYITGPMHLYMHAFFYFLLGFNKTAILAHFLLVNAVIVAITFFLARRRLALLNSLLLAGLSALCFYGPTSHPWYDQNAYFWLVLGILIVEIWPPSKGIQRASISAFLCGFLLGLSFFTKSNIGLVGGLTFLAFFSVQKPRLRLVSFYCAGGLISIALLLGTLESPSDFIFQTFFAYDYRTRLADIGQLWLVLNFLPYLQFLVLLAIIAGLGGSAYIREKLGEIVLLAGLLLTSIFAAFSGSMLFYANITLLGIEMTYLFRLAQSLPNNPASPAEKRIYRTSHLVLVFLACYWLLYSGQATNRRYTWRWKPSNLTNDYVLQTESLKGWKCNRQIGEGLDRAVVYINENVPQQDSLFVFPDVTVIYGLTGRESFRKTPFIFHLNQIPSNGKLYADFRRHFLEIPPKWLLLHHQTEIAFYDTGRLLRWLRLDGFISQNYNQVWQWGDFALLRHSGVRTGGKIPD